MMTHDEALSLLDDLDNCGGPVTNWESEFLDSLLKQLESDAARVPSAAQQETLREMKEKYL